MLYQRSHYQVHVQQNSFGFILAYKTRNGVIMTVSYGMVKNYLGTFKREYFHNAPFPYLVGLKHVQ